MEIVIVAAIFGIIMVVGLISKACRQPSTNRQQQNQPGNKAQFSDVEKALKDTLVRKLSHVEESQQNDECVICREPLYADPTDPIDANKSDTNVVLAITLPKASRVEPSNTHVGCLLNWFRRKVTNPLTRSNVTPDALFDVVAPQSSQSKLQT